MRIVIDGWNSLKQNLGVVYFYVGVHVLLALVFAAVGVYLKPYMPEAGSIPRWYQGYQFLQELVSAGVVSAVQAVAFARLGREIDKPLWKCPTDGEALRRFFMPWFLLNLFTLLIGSLSLQATQRELMDVASVLMMLQLIALLFVVPVGTCVMYWGRFRWRELGEALTPLVRQMPDVLIVFVMLFAQFIVFYAEQYYLFLTQENPVAQALAPPIAFIPMTLLELLAFAVLWRFCMINRDAEVEDGGPFDF